MDNWEVKMDQEIRARKLRNAMRRLRIKLAEKKKADEAKRKEWEKKEKQFEPRYDEVYFKGLEWLNSL